MGITKPKHFGHLGVRAAIPWVRCPLCASPMSLREKRDKKSVIYGCKLGKCRGTREAEPVDNFLVDMLQGTGQLGIQCDLPTEVQAVDAMGPSAHLIHPTGLSIHFVCRKSTLGVSRTVRSEQKKRIKAEETTLKHLIPGRWNPEVGGWAVVTSPVSSSGFSTLPTGAVVEMVGRDAAPLIRWGSTDRTIGGATLAKLGPLRDGDTLWAVEGPPEYLYDRWVVRIRLDTPLSELRVSRSNRPPFDFRVTTPTDLGDPIQCIQFLRVPNADMKIRSLFRVEGSARPLQVVAFDYNHLEIQVLADNGTRHRLSDVTLLTEDEVDEVEEPPSTKGGYVFGQGLS